MKGGDNRVFAGAKPRPLNSQEASKGPDEGQLSILAKIEEGGCAPHLDSRWTPVGTQL